MNVGLNVSSVYRSNTEVLPTPLSPINKSLNKRSYVLCCGPPGIPPPCTAVLVAISPKSILLSVYHGLGHHA